MTPPHLREREKFWVKCYIMPKKSQTKAPSEMLRYLDDALEKVLPDDEYQKLTSHDSEIAKTTSRGDFHRCFRCAEWAVELTAQPEHSHLHHVVIELKAIVHEIHDTDFAVEFGIMTPGRTVTDLELTWVDDAIKVAQAAAERSGWASVPWEHLLEELVAIEPGRN
jgi:hypothetical protein